MDLYKDILIEILSKENLIINISGVNKDLSHVIEMKCYEALKNIKIILENDSLTDKECFNKIENIIQIFEKIGSTCGNRHDFI